MTVAQHLCRAAEDGMAAADRPISSDELHAYVDDRLDADRRLAVERCLDTQPELARRVAAYRTQRDGLRAAFAPLAASPIPPQLNLNHLLEARLRQRPIWWRAAAVVVLCLGLGGAVGWYVGSSPRPSRNELAMSLLQQQAMASHVVYADDRRHPIEVTAADSEHLSQWLSNRLRRSVAPPDLSPLGYRLLGGRLLATEHGGAAALFVYDDADGHRLTVLFRPMAPELRAVRTDGTQGPLNSCAWIASGMGYAVVAAEANQTLDQIADQVRQQAANAG
jgi:anti-sigma factor RsiW